MPPVADGLAPEDVDAAWLTRRLRAAGTIRDASVVSVAATPVGVGMLGVLIILRPGSGTFGIWSLVALGAMLLVAVRDLSTRQFGRDISSNTIAFYGAVLVTLTGFVLSLGQGWVMPQLWHLALLALGSAFLTVGYLCAVAAMRVGEIAAVSPFRYTSLLMAIFLGLVIFGDWPDLWTWVGSALVVGAGIYTIWREAQLGRRC